MAGLFDQAFAKVESATQHERAGRMLEAAKDLDNAAELFRQCLPLCKDEPSKALVRKNREEFENKAKDIRAWVTRTNRAVQQSKDPLAVAIQNNEQIVARVQAQINRIMAQPNLDQEKKLKRCSELRLAMLRSCTENIEIALREQKAKHLHSGVQPSSASAALSPATPRASGAPASKSTPAVMQAHTLTQLLLRMQTSSSPSSVTSRLITALARQASSRQLASFSSQFQDVMTQLAQLQQSAIVSVERIRAGRDPSGETLLLHYVRVATNIREHRRRLVKGSLAFLTEQEECLLALKGDHDELLRVTDPDEGDGGNDHLAYETAQRSFVDMCAQITSLLEIDARERAGEEQSQRILNTMHRSAKQAFDELFLALSTHTNSLSSDIILETFFPALITYANAVTECILQVMVAITCSLEVQARSPNPSNTPSVQFLNAPCARELVETAVATSVMAQVYPRIVEIVNERMVVEDMVIREFCDRMRESFHLRSLEVPPKFILTEQRFDQERRQGSCHGYALAARTLQQIESCTTLHSKLRCLKNTANAITAAITMHHLAVTDYGADVFLPLLMYVMLCADIKNLKTEAEILRMMGEGSRAALGELGYLLVTFSIAAQHLENMARDSGKRDSVKLGDTVAKDATGDLVEGIDIRKLEDILDSDLLPGTGDGLTESEAGAGATQTRRASGRDRSVGGDNWVVDLQDLAPGNLAIAHSNDHTQPASSSTYTLPASDTAPVSVPNTADCLDSWLGVDLTQASIPMPAPTPSPAPTPTDLE
eukprot:c15416_g1_i1.p1 GENE.c15416_g1_i1~~c15416_g1_i1.p1  ORF type:complete len:772 (+),score=221.78 c15416_g1_i1:32-2347(+)